MSELAHYLEPNFLRDLANVVVALPSVSDDLKEANLDERALVEAMLNEPELSETIEHAISEPVAQADRLEKEIDALRSQTPDFGQIADSDFGKITDTFGPSLSVLCYFLAIVAIPCLIVGWAFVYPEGNVFPVGTRLTDKLQKAMFDPHVIVAILVTCGSLVVLAQFMARSPGIARKPVREEARASRAEMKQRIEKATAEHAALKSEIPNVVRDKVLTPIARIILAREVKRSYEPILQGKAAPLGEVFDPRFETETKSRKELEYLISAMSGGSIGISGSRGSGKTTLINYFCRRSDGSWKPRDRPVLAFSTPAPARYEARDFVLHLFATVCKTVLAAVGESSVPENGNRRMQSSHPALLAFLQYRRAMSILGSLILWASASVFVLRMVDILHDPPDLDLMWWSDKFDNLSKTLGLNLGVCFLVGSVLWVIGGWARRIEVIMRQEASRRPEFPGNEGNAELSREAGKHLEIIRFQRNFTSGWSGTLSLPFSLAGSASEGQQLTERQESLPEIIDRYRKFVGIVKRDYTLVIGIDELDKMKSDEAEMFLNDHKVLFGLEGCFYLVSISESALAQFERRGLPLRDTFDSSFDEVLHVGYLNTAQAIALLRNRVARLPVPFVCLCHCLAGGLPRDIIRVCRSLYVTAEETKKCTLHELSKALIQQDFYRKCRAMALSAKLGTDSASKFLIAVNGLDDEEPSVELFDNRALYFFPVKTLPEESSDDDRSLAALCREFGSYLLYCATLLAFFGDRLDVSAIKEAEQNGLFDRLAKARQSLSVDPTLSWHLCIEFRKSIGLSEPQLVPDKIALSKSGDLLSTNRIAPRVKT